MRGHGNVQAEGSCAMKKGGCKLPADGTTIDCWCAERFFSPLDGDLISKMLSHFSKYAFTLGEVTVSLYRSR
jgi:hypothetical protein